MGHIHLSGLKNKSVYLCPYNDEAIYFYQALCEEINFKFLGYIDNFKTDENVVGMDKITKDFDYIVILSPNYHQEISDTLLSYNISKTKVLFSNRTNKKSTTIYLYSNQHIYQTFNFIFSAITKIKHQFFNKYKKFKNLLKHLKLYYYQVFHTNYLKIFKLKNAYTNQRAFILGNGPSLKITDLDELKNEITFAANKIYLSFDQTQWRPTYYFVTDVYVYLQNLSKIKSLKLNNFFSTKMLSAEEKIKDSTYFNVLYKPTQKITINPILGIHSGSTVVCVMIEMAIYMGIKEIYLIGLDFNFELPSNTTSHELICEGEQNHFHKDYRKVGEKWTKPNMQLQKEAFLKIKEYCESNNIRIYNASHSTHLNVFERVEFEDIL